MIIWRGWGFVVAVCVFFSSLAANILAELLGGKQYWETHAWPFGTAMLVASAIIGITDYVLAGRPKRRLLVDESTGERVVLSDSHTFFFLRLRWWALAVGAFGAYVLFTNMVPGPGTYRSSRLNQSTGRMSFAALPN